MVKWIFEYDFKKIIESERFMNDFRESDSQKPYQVKKI